MYSLSLCTVRWESLFISFHTVLHCVLMRNGLKYVCFNWENLVFFRIRNRLFFPYSFSSPKISCAQADWWPQDYGFGQSGMVEKSPESCKLNSVKEEWEEEKSECLSPLLKCLCLCPSELRWSFQWCTALQTFLFGMSNLSLCFWRKWKGVLDMSHPLPLLQVLTFHLKKYVNNMGERSTSFWIRIVALII